MMASLTHLVGICPNYEIAPLTSLGHRDSAGFAMAIEPSFRRWQRTGIVTPAARSLVLARTSHKISASGAASADSNVEKMEYDCALRALEQARYFRASTSDVALLLQLGKYSRASVALPGGDDLDFPRFIRATLNSMLADRQHQPTASWFRDHYEETAPKWQPAPRSSAAPLGRWSPLKRAASAPKQRVEHASSAEPAKKRDSIAARARALVPELSEMVQRATGLRVDLSDVENIEASSDELWTLSWVEYMRRLYPENPEYWHPPAPRRAWNPLIERGKKLEFVAAYLTKRHTIVWVRERAEHLNDAALRSVLFHELVHAAQLRAFPRWGHYRDRLQRQSHDANLPNSGVDANRRDALKESASVTRTFLEGYAQLFQSVSATSRFRQARSELSWPDRVALYLYRHTAAGRREMQYYEEGCKCVSRLSEHPELLQAVLRYPSLVDVLLTHTKQAYLEWVPAAERDHLHMLANRIRKFNPGCKRIIMAAE